MNDLNLRTETLKKLQKNKENTSGYVETELPNEDSIGFTCNEKVSAQHYKTWT